MKCFLFLFLQNVLRRKMDDAMAVSRRLKEALALHGNKLSGKSSSQSTGPENEQRIKSIFNIKKKTALILAYYSCYFLFERLVEIRTGFIGQD